MSTNVDEAKALLEQASPQSTQEDLLNLIAHALLALSQRGETPTLRRKG